MKRKFFFCLVAWLIARCLDSTRMSDNSRSSAFAFRVQPTSRRRSASRTGAVRPGGRRRPAVVGVTAAPTSRHAPSTPPPGFSRPPLPPPPPWTWRGRRRRCERDRSPATVRETAAARPWNRRPTARLKSTSYCSSLPDSF